MDFEKKYNEALERARKIHDEIVNNEVIGFPEQITDIFPELRESEDERIRKEIIDFLETIPASELKRIPRPINEWFAWLEKQKESHIPWYDYQKSKEAGYTIVPNEEYEQLIKQKEPKPAEWSEEEIGHLYTLARYIKSKGYEDDGEFLEGVANKLKSLRPSWKPSDEAVEGLFQNTPFPTICLDDCKEYNFKDGDKVRIIIVKEN